MQVYNEIIKYLNIFIMYVYYFHYLLKDNHCNSGSLNKSKDASCPRQHFSSQKLDLPVSSTFWQVLTCQILQPSNQSQSASFDFSYINATCQFQPSNQRLNMPISTYCPLPRPASFNLHPKQPPHSHNLPVLALKPVKAV